MKQESLKHLQKMHEMCSDNGTITNVGNLIRMREMIEAIIRIESETKNKGKFSLWDYVSKDDIRPSMCCVLHDSGYKVASDAHILVVLKEDYPEDMEGKLMKKDGTIENENVTFPKWRMVIPDPKKTEMVAVRLDFAGIRQFEADFKAKMKAENRKYAITAVRVTENCWFKLEYLVKTARAMEHIGTDTLMVNADGRRAALASSDKGYALLMPIVCPENADFAYEL